ncbi:uncharacterized protein EKO05_0000993 [Ascochyta rabiei]|uniref:uncharacterized protein n=1 Tax=Didymella rabiei TaxID=5454 RepID=UPI0021F9C3E0|nr:uncharacterized protein EKO05_0000993 [Ascochyta rabiei]UPX10327.1 hypothetical protein EKO05_0000993 [Ascochyta rabiei]
MGERACSQLQKAHLTSKPRMSNVGHKLVDLFITQFSWTTRSLLWCDAISLESVGNLSCRDAKQFCDEFMRMPSKAQSVNLQPLVAR